MYEGTSTEQKEKNAKSGLDSMSKPLLQSIHQRNALLPPFTQRRLDSVCLIYMACFSPLYRQSKNRMICFVQVIRFFLLYYVILFFLELIEKALFARSVGHIAFIKLLQKIFLFICKLSRNVNNNMNKKVIFCNTVEPLNTLAL